MKKLLLPLLLVSAFAPVSPAFPDKAPEFDRQALHNQAANESLTPVRPGEPGKTAFWNVNSSRFIFAPAFDFSALPGTETYRFTATSDTDGKECVFLADKPWATLAPVWSEIPVGYVSLVVDGLDSASKVVGTAGRRRFYRAAVFDGPYHEPPPYGYTESARRALKFLFDSSWLQKWLTEGAPDSSYVLYCYPSKMIGAIIHGMLLYSRLAPADSATAIRIATVAGKYLIAHSQPENSPLAYLPPTYDSSRLDEKVYGKDPAYIYRDQIMLIYPPQVALAYLDLYVAAGDTSFLIAAVRIADTFARIQLVDGNWPLKMDFRTGKAVSGNFVRAGVVLEMFRRLNDVYGLDKYDKNLRAAEVNYLRPFENFNFEGQFEDVPPSSLYENLTHYAAVEAANYYLDHAAGQPHNLDMAREYLRFAEDQFVVWERPNPVPRPENKNRRSDDWITPCALEQYHYYVPIDASAANFISVFFKAFKVTGDSLYLAKAVSLANSMVEAQNKETGKYPTYWWKAQMDRPGWINCAISAAGAMYDFGSFMERGGDSH